MDELRFKIDAFRPDTIPMARLTGYMAGSLNPCQKVKIDRQIVAIGVTERATTIYSDDLGIVALAKVARTDAVSSWELPLPPTEPQGSFDL